MPKPKIPNSRKAALEHRKRIERYAALINQLYDKLNKEAAKAALGVNPDVEKPFSWSDYPETRKALKELQDRYISEMTSIVMSGTSAEWKESNLVQDLVAQKLLKAYVGTTKTGEEYARYFQTDPDALKAFQKRKAGGMNLSQRVWKLSEQYKAELEESISAAIEPGSSAIELAAEIKKYLNEPDKRFRRVRDKFGELQLSANAKAYHPGQGVYRSSARNAQRLARTEINMAYRAAEQERWKSFDFVVGYEVKITQNGKHVEDICDCLKGKYRKDFKFMGWHPQCMCYAVPILKTEDEFFDDDEDAKSVNEVEDVPQGFKDWVKDNEERIEKAEKRGTVPYFIADNRGEVNKILGEDRNKKSPDAGIVVLTEQQKERRAEIRKIARAEIANRPIAVPGIDRQVSISNGKIKEWVNQPHKHYVAKNEALLRLPELIAGGTYEGCGVDEHDPTAIAHLVRVKIEGDYSWVVIRELNDGTIGVHSISDSPSIVKKTIKKKP